MVYVFLERPLPGPLLITGIPCSSFPQEGRRERGKSKFYLNVIQLIKYACTDLKLLFNLKIKRLDAVAKNSLWFKKFL